MIAAIALALAIGIGAEAPPFYADKLDLLHYINADGDRVDVRSGSDWQIRRGHVLANMQKVMGPLPAIDRDAPLDVRVIEETVHDGYVRRKITFAVEAGDRLPAYLLLPRPAVDDAAAMVCLHPTSPFGKGMVVGLGDKPNRNYAEELAQRGFVTIAPDYPGFGDYDVDVYAMGYVSATMKGIVNHMRCVDLLRSLPEVDGERIGAIGHSLGGHNALFLAAFDKRVKVAVSSCGFNRFAKYYGGDLTGWSHDGYMPKIAEVYDKDPAKMPFDWTEVLASIAPRPVFVSAPLNDANFEVSGVRDCEAAARPVYALFDAADRLRVAYPDSGHDFPPAIRERAYEYVERALAD